jgi:hypothetical protein
VGLDGVLADEEAGGDLAVAEALSDEGEDFELARSDAEGVELGLVEGEGSWGGLLVWRGGDQDFAEDDFFAGFGELDAEPDAEAGEEDGDDGAIDFEGVFDDEELVLRPTEDGDEDAADEAEDEDVALHGCWMDFTAMAGVGVQALIFQGDFVVGLSSALNSKNNSLVLILLNLNFEVGHAIEAFSAGHVAGRVRARY